MTLGFNGYIPAEMKKLESNYPFDLEEFTQRAINVKWFGAKGDGITDDTEAIQNTITSLPNGGTIIIPEGKYVINNYINILTSNITIKNSGKSPTLLINQNAGLKIGNNDNPVWKWKIIGIEFNKIPDTNPNFAIQLTNAREGLLSFNRIVGFNNGIDVLDNCWSNRFIENEVLSCDIGINFNGIQLNALCLYGGRIQTNRIGILINANYNGIYIGNGLQLELNTEYDIKLEKGMGRGLFIYNVYNETSSRFFCAQGNGVDNLSCHDYYIQNVYMFSPSPESPILIDSTAKSGDYIWGYIKNIYAWNLPANKKLADISGSQARAKIEDCNVRDINNLQIFPYHNNLNNGVGMSINHSYREVNFSTENLKLTDGKLLAKSGIGIGNTVASSTLGNLIKKMQIFDENGNPIGYIPIYDIIT